LGIWKDIFANDYLAVAQVSGCVSFENWETDGNTACKDSLRTWKKSLGRKVLNIGWICQKEDRWCRSCNVYIIQPSPSLALPNSRVTA
jgi:hypothetical protein